MKTDLDLENIDLEDIDYFTKEDIEDLRISFQKRNELLQIIIKYVTLKEKCDKYEMKIQNLEYKIEELEEKNSNYARKIEKLIYKKEEI